MKNKKYIFLPERQNWHGTPQTDTIIEIVPDYYTIHRHNLELIFTQKMDEKEYNQTILANSHIRFADIHDKDELIQVDVYIQI